jgi:transposase
MFAGIDWASQEHAVCVHDGAGHKLASFTITHSAVGFEDLVGRLARFGEPAELPVAIERPDGRLVDRLLEAGHPVVPVSSNAIKAWREAEVTSGAKSDPGDAETICEYLRLRIHRLRPLQPYSQHTRALRAAVRARTDLVTQRVAANNQLEATLDAFWPGGKTVFADVTSKIALAFLERYPTPTSAAALGEKRLAAFCAKHGYSGRRSPQELLERLRAAPPGIADGAESAARKEIVLSFVHVLRALNQAIADLDRAVTVRLTEHPDAGIFTSLPRSGQINAAQILAEWGDCRDAYDNAESVAALAGVSPVTKQSGKYRSVGFRWACNKRFRNAIVTFADNSRHASSWAAGVYRRAIERGHDHPHAIRILARAWIRVIYRCWVDRAPYEPTKHGAAAHIEAPSQHECAA